LLEAAVAKPGAEPKTHLQLAEVLQRLGEFDAARWQALRALDRDPDLSEPYGLLLQLARRLDQPEQLRFWVPLVRAAEERIRAGLLLSRRTWARPDDATAHRDLALHLLKAVELRKAESHLEEALRLRPGWEEARAALERVRRIREVL
jgi:tetratricopeptide (TPR) repeat protein